MPHLQSDQLSHPFIPNPGQQASQAPRFRVQRGHGLYRGHITNHFRFVILRYGVGHRHARLGSPCSSSITHVHSLCRWGLSIFQQARQHHAMIPIGLIGTSFILAFMLFICDAETWTGIFGTVRDVLLGFAVSECSINIPALSAGHVKGQILNAHAITLHTTHAHVYAGNDVHSWMCPDDGQLSIYSSLLVYALVPSMDHWVPSCISVPQNRWAKSVSEQANTSSPSTVLNNTPATPPHTKKRGPALMLRLEALYFTGDENHNPIK